MKHLTLVEQYKYFENFINLYIKKMTDEKDKAQNKLSTLVVDSKEINPLNAQIIGYTKCLHDLSELRNTTLKKLVSNDEDSIYHTDSLKPVSKEYAEKNWSGKAEGKRLKAAKELLTTARNQANAILENAGVPEVNIVDYENCVNIARSKRNSILNIENKIEINNEFTITTDKGIDIATQITTTQFDEKFIGSMDKRIRDPETKKLYAVNIHRERVILTDPSGNKIETTQLRSGSFDMNGIKKFDKQGMLLEKYKLPPKENFSIPKNDPQVNEIKELILGTVDPNQLDDLIDGVRLARDPKKFAPWIYALKELASEDKLPLSLNPKGWDHAIIKFEADYADMAYDAEVIELNAEVMKHTFETAKNDDANPMKKLGYKAPSVVQSILDGIPSLGGKGAQNWGMISLQSPVNVGNKKGFNALISQARTKLGRYLKTHEEDKISFKFFVKPLLKHLDQLVGTETSELDPVYRELKGYEKACKGDVENGLYFNFPTNFVGA